jgi:hypothetical protein
LAGLLEGEGCFYIDSSVPTVRSKIGVRLEMADKDVIQRACNIMPNSGKVSAVNREDKPGTKTTFVARWYGQKAENIMKRVLPYMGERRKAKIEECLRTPNLSHHVKEKI